MSTSFRTPKPVVVGPVDMKHFTIEVAGLRIRLNVPSPSTYAYCIGYLSEGEPDLVVDITEEDVRREIDTSAKNSPYLNIPYLETVAAYRKIVEAVADFGLFLMHGAVVGVGGDAYMFSAPSGTGKTTHMRKWLQNVDGAYVVNGDKPLIRPDGASVTVYGTPWCGKERLGSNVSATLRTVAFLKRSEENHLEELSFAEAYPYLIKHTHLPDDTARAMRTLDLLSRVSGKLRFLLFRCNNFKDDCLKVAYRAIVR